LLSQIQIIGLDFDPKLKGSKKIFTNENIPVSHNKSLFYSIFIFFSIPRTVEYLYIFRRVGEEIREGWEPIRTVLLDNCFYIKILRNFMGLELNPNKY